MPRRGGRENVSSIRIVSKICSVNEGLTYVQGQKMHVYLEGYRQSNIRGPNTYRIIDLP